MKFSLTLLAACLTLATFAQKKKSNTETAPPEKKVFALGVIDSVVSTQLSETRRLNIYLPEGYSSADTTKYPVIYLLDGSANEDFIHVTGIVQFLTMIETMPKAIIVGIANVDRRRDFTFPTTNKEDLKQYPTTGGSEKFIAFLEKDLQPYIEKNYKTNGKKTIIGQSLGGLLATEVLLKKSTLFDTYIIVSPSLWWSDEAMLADAEALLKKEDANAMVYVAVGNEGKQMQGDVEKLVEILRGDAGKNIRLKYASFPEESHLTILHRAVYKAFEVINAHR